MDKVNPRNVGTWAIAGVPDKKRVSTTRTSLSQRSSFEHSLSQEDRTEWARQ
jgi:hypothetical protein